VKADGAVIMVKATDGYGNKTTREAEGALKINIDGNDGSGKEDDEKKSNSLK